VLKGVRVYCSTCGTRRGPGIGPCCPPYPPGQSDGLIGEWGWEDWGRDQQALVRVLVEQFGEGASLAALVERSGLAADRVRQAAQSRARPLAASFSPILATMGHGGFWFYLCDRAWDGLPPFLKREKDDGC
jgi:hypothetical protein